MSLQHYHASLCIILFELADFFNRFATCHAGNSCVAIDLWISLPNSFAASVSFLASSSSCSLCRLSSWISLSLFLFIPCLSKSSYTLNSNSTAKHFTCIQLGFYFFSRKKTITSTWLFFLDLNLYLNFLHLCFTSCNCVSCAGKSGRLVSVGVAKI